MRALQFSLALLAVAAQASPYSPKVIDLGYAKYTGKHNATLGITEYYSIRYAAPPLGNLRWRAPVPIDTCAYYKSSPVINASVPQHECYQLYPTWIRQISEQVRSGQIPSNRSEVAKDLSPGPAPGNSISESEDCLMLDVYVPDKPVSPELPVVVLIHGGGYVEGNALDHGGSQLVSFSEGKIIHVAVQYRLGSFGFLSGAEVKADGTANAGLLDQRLALEWVQRHISAFGGDPNQVTIWGDSAGGGSVNAQMIMYGGSPKPPFSAVIPEYPYRQPFKQDRLLELQYQSLLKATNCTSLKCLRAVDSGVLANATIAATDADYASKLYGYGDFWWGPSVDGHIVQDLPSREFAAGHFTPVPMMIDHDAYEGFLFTNFSMSEESQVQQSLAQLWPDIGPAGSKRQSAFFAKLFSLYPLSDFAGAYFDKPIFSYYSGILPTTGNNSAFWQRQTIHGDYVIDCPTYWMAKALVDAKQTVYKMIFAAGRQIHAADYNYLLGASKQTDNPTLADTIKDYFVGFITKQDPNASQKVKKTYWPAYTIGSVKSADHQVLVFEDHDVTTERDPDASERCDFFESQASILRN